MADYTSCNLPGSHYSTWFTELLVPCGSLWSCALLYLTVAFVARNVFISIHTEIQSVGLLHHPSIGNNWNSGPKYNDIFHIII